MDAQTHVEDIVDFLAHNHLSRVRETGSSNLKARCPFHKGGMEDDPSFSISRENGLWMCWACNEAGNLKSLMTHFGMDASELPHIPRAAPKTERELDELPVGILEIFHHCPKKLLQAGFDKEVLRQHEIGFDRRPQFGKITFPVFSNDGVFRGVSGRVRDTSPERRKYKFYTKEDFEEIIVLDRYEFKRRYYLWREQFVVSGTDIFVAEGFKAALWLAQHGYNSVATMGTQVTDDQISKLSKLNPTRVYIFFDDDIWGIKATKKLIPRLALAGLLDIRVCRYPEGADEPDALNGSQLENAIEYAMDLGEFLTTK